MQLFLIERLGRLLVSHTLLEKPHDGSLVPLHHGIGQLSTLYDVDGVGQVGQLPEGLLVADESSGVQLLVLSVPFLEGSGVFSFESYKSGDVVLHYLVQQVLDIVWLQSLHYLLVEQFELLSAEVLLSFEPVIKHYLDCLVQLSLEPCVQLLILVDVLCELVELLEIVHVRQSVRQVISCRVDALEHEVDSGDVRLVSLDQSLELGVVSVSSDRQLGSFCE